MSPHRRKIVLFDLDKTLIDPFWETRQQAIHHWNTEIASSLKSDAFSISDDDFSLRAQWDLYDATLESDSKLQKPGRIVEVFKTILQNKLSQLPAPKQHDYLDSIFGKDGMHEAAFVTTMRNIRIDSQDVSYPGIETLLADLARSNNILFAVTQRQPREPDDPTSVFKPKCKLTKYFSPGHIVSGDKSTPEGRLEIIKKLNEQLFADDRIVYVGDQPSDAKLAAELKKADLVVSTYGQDQIYLEKQVRPAMQEATQALTRNGHSCTEAATVPQLHETLKRKGYCSAILKATRTPPDAASR